MSLGPLKCISAGYQADILEHSKKSKMAANISLNESIHQNFLTIRARIEFNTTFPAKSKVRNPFMGLIFNLEVKIIVEHQVYCLFKEEYEVYCTQNHM